MEEQWRRHVLQCRRCGHEGGLSIWTRGKIDWGYVIDGFRAQAVDRLSPAQTRFACTSCGSADVAVGEPAAPSG